MPEPAPRIRSRDLAGPLSTPWSRRALWPPYQAQLDRSTNAAVAGWDVWARASPPVIRHLIILCAEQLSEKGVHHRKPHLRCSRAKHSVHSSPSTSQFSPQLNKEVHAEIRTLDTRQRRRGWRLRRRRRRHLHDLLRRRRPSDWLAGWLTVTGKCYGEDRTED